MLLGFPGTLTDGYIQLLHRYVVLTRAALNLIQVAGLRLLSVQVLFFLRPHLANISSSQFATVYTSIDYSFNSLSGICDVSSIQKLLLQGHG